MVLEIDDFKAAQVVVDSIYIFPVKSCDGIQVQEATVFQKGLKYDRQFVVTDTEYNALTSPERFRLVAVKTKFVDVDGKFLVELSTSTLDEKVYLDPSDKGEAVEVSVKGTKLKGSKCSDQINTWISQLLGYPAFIINQGSGHRPAITNYLETENLTEVEAKIGYSDKYSILLASQESLNQLQAELNQLESDQIPQLTMRHFRFNVIVSGIPVPYGEDNISLATIGGQVKVHFDLPCPRCPSVNKNPEDPQEDTKLPLQQLMRTRRCYPHIDKLKSYFGISLIPLNEGTIKVGDQLNVLKTSTK